MNGEKTLRRLPFCSAIKNLSLFDFASVSTIPRGACALPSAMVAVNTRPLNSAAAADKSEAVASVLCPAPAADRECAVPAPPVRARCPGAGVRPLPRSREALSPVSSNRPDLRGIHAVFCLSFHPSCRLVASGRQSRWLLRRARLHTKMQKRDAVCRKAFFVSLLQRHSASARREITSYRFKYYTAENG